MKSMAKTHQKLVGFWGGSSKQDQRCISHLRSSALQQLHLHARTVWLISLKEVRNLPWSFFVDLSHGGSSFLCILRCVFSPSTIWFRCHTYSLAAVLEPDAAAIDSQMCGYSECGYSRCVGRVNVTKHIWGPVWKAIFSTFAWSIFHLLTISQELMQHPEGVMQCTQLLRKGCYICAYLVCGWFWNSRASTGWFHLKYSCCISEEEGSL